MILAKVIARKESIMAKLLYVSCDLKPVEHSPSLIVGSEFLNEYLNGTRKMTSTCSTYTATISNVSMRMY